MNDTGAQVLVEAIILQAVKDFRSSLSKRKKRRYGTCVQKSTDECEQFFRSGWFAHMTKLDGEQLIKDLYNETFGGM